MCPKGIFSTFQGILAILQMWKKLHSTHASSSVATCKNHLPALVLSRAFPQAILKLSLFGLNNTCDLSLPGASCTQNSFPWNEIALKCHHVLKCYREDFPPPLKSKLHPHLKKKSILQIPNATCHKKTSFPFTCSRSRQSTAILNMLKLPNI